MNRNAVSILLTVLCGIGIVVAETPANLLLSAVWATVVVLATRRFRVSAGIGKCVQTAGVHFGVMGMIVVAAFLAPVKRIDVMLQQRIILPGHETTVRELAEFCDANRTSLPVRITLPSDGPAADLPIRFSETSVSVRQFIAEIEQQTGCSHGISGCGNAYSILYGPAFNFGLSLRALQSKAIFR